MHERPVQGPSPFPKPHAHEPEAYGDAAESMMADHHGRHAVGSSSAHHPAHDARRAVEAHCHHDAIKAHPAHGGTRR